MTEPDPREYLADPLSPIARAERRNLLLASTVAILIAHVNLVPTRISALGLEFAPPAQASFVVITSLVVGYFIVAFATYAVADLFVWRKRYYDYLAAVEKESQGWTLEDQIAHDEIHANLPTIDWYYQWSPRVANVRMLFEFVLPLLVGAYAVSALVWRLNALT
jgi:amino acid transporter